MDFDVSPTMIEPQIPAQILHNFGIRTHWHTCFHFMPSRRTVCSSICVHPDPIPRQKPHTKHLFSIELQPLSTFPISNENSAMNL